MKIVIVGGVAGGASAAARLRRLDENAEIIIIERGESVSFANCGLPYYLGGEIRDYAGLNVYTPMGFQTRFNVDVRINSEVTAIDTVNKTVTVCDIKRRNTVYVESYDKLVLSPGASPYVPSLGVSSSDRVFTLRGAADALRIRTCIERKNARSAIIIGGGYIGVEMAENLKKIGIKVSIVELADHLISSLDFDMAADVQRYLKSKGIEVFLNGVIKSVKDGKSSVSVDLGTRFISADMLIVALGVMPDTKFAEAAGINCSRRGCIIVNGNMQTSASDVYAVGDAVACENFITGTPDYIPLAGPANKQGRIAADNIMGIHSEYRGTQGSAVIKLFDMTVAMTGISEKAASVRKIPYDKTYIYAPSHASFYPGATNMSIKIIWNKKNRRVLGAQIVGFDGVDKRMDVIATAVRFGARITDFASLELCYAPPFSSAKDPVNLIGCVAENIISGRLKQLFWHDVEKIPHNGTGILIDVRSETEFKRAHINGAINIPLERFREFAARIPTDKPVYVYCQTGHRSYLASCILAGVGHKRVYNLAGGWRLYDAVISERALLGNDYAGLLSN